MSCFKHHPLTYYGENRGKIGSGVYSHVQQYCRKEGENEIDTVAIKVHTKKVSAFREIALLEECQPSPHIVPLLDVGYDSRRQRFYQVMPMGCCTIYEQIITGYFKNNPDRIKKAIFQILHGIACLHVKGYIHRDMKSENILVFKDEKPKEYTYKLCDFGLSRKANLPGESYTSYMVTLYYRPPENLLDQDQYTQAIDMWSVGCIFAELILKNPPFAYEESIQVIEKQLECLANPKDSYPSYIQSRIKKIRKKKFTEGKKWWNKNIKEKVCDMCGIEAYDLLSQFLQLDPSKRISSRRALSHPYFSEFIACPLKIPLIHLNRIYYPQDWRSRIKNLSWSNRNTIFLRCCDLGILNDIPIHSIITCYFFLNKLIVLAPQWITFETADLYMRAILSVVSKVNCCNVLHLRHLEENNDIRHLRKCRNKFLHTMRFQLALHTGQDWFGESRNKQQQRKLAKEHKNWRKMFSEALALYRVTIFIPQLFFCFPPEEVAEGCQYYILKHYGFEVDGQERIQEQIAEYIHSATKLLKKNKNFNDVVLSQLSILST